MTSGKLGSVAATRIAILEGTARAWRRTRWAQNPARETMRLAARLSLRKQRNLPWSAGLEEEFQLYLQQRHRITQQYRDQVESA